MKTYKNHINIINPECDNCCGCTACLQSCPKGCISMQLDSEGFLYPKVDETACIDCGVCTKVCSWLKDKTEEVSGYPIVYAVKHKSDKIRRQSTSGGVFTAIAEYVIAKGGVVYGAAFVPKNRQVEYIQATTIEDLQRIRGSKYVQSFLGDTYKQVKTYLQDGRIVLFTGTPCHCSGLKDYLKRPYENLFVVDILCHSAPSPMIFENLISKYEKLFGSPVTDIIFRDKSKGWRGSYHCVVSSKDKIFENNTYLTLFFKGVINRPSCHNCRYASTIRPGDLTIGDYWNIDTVDKDFEDSLGVSCLLVNNSHGKNLLGEISNDLNCFETGLDPAIQDCMKKKAGVPLGKNKFWNDYKAYGFDYCERKYGHVSRWQLFRYKVIGGLISKLGLTRLKEYLISKIR